MKKIIVIGSALAGGYVAIKKFFVPLIKLSWDQALTKRFEENMKNGKIFEQDGHYYYVLK